jgi:hypothetical protein
MAKKKKPEIDPETFKELVSGLFSPGGTVGVAKKVYGVLVGTRLYIGTDFNDIGIFCSFWNKKWNLIDVHMTSYKDIPIRLMEEDFRKLRK